MNIATLENRLRHPKQFEEDFYNFFAAIDAKTDVEKTLAEQTRFDSRTLAGASITEFFKTDPIPGNTNLNQFIPPESEHQLITAIRIWEGALFGPIFDTDWVPGAQDPAVKNARITITNNGVKALDEVPLSDLIPDLTTRDVGLYSLNEPIPWLGQTKLIVSIDLPGILAGATNLRVGLKGLAYIS